MDSLKNLTYLLEKRNSTALGVGPMSLNCINATIELANDNNVPLMMIASRRQIDCDSLGGGYVNNWSTENISRYINQNDNFSNIVMSRDHGGPYQNNREIEERYNTEEAMKSAKISFEVDIKNNFQIIHIDPSIDPNNELSTEIIIERLKELYDFCIETAEKNNKTIEIEIGTEEQSGGMNSIEELDYSLNEISKFCKKNNFKKPLFIVVQTGTKVIETKNIGIFRDFSDEFERSQVPSLLKLCEKYGIYIKQHNTDYLESEFLNKHPKFGIHAANIAPEYGVAETRKIFELIENKGLPKIKDEMIELFVSSNKWQKWVMNKEKIDDYQKALICGHYLFSSNKFLDIKNKLCHELKCNLKEIDLELKNAVKQSIYRHMKCFNLIIS